MHRRSFLTLLGGTAAAWPLAVRAQQRPLPVIGLLRGDSSAASATWMPAFHQGLSQSGFVEGRNVTIESRWRDNQLGFPALAADLVRRQVTVIVAGPQGAAQAARAATTAIPIVFEMAGDPVANGFVTSLNRPGGNLTGVTTLGAEVAPKRFELLRELVPTATVMALLVGVDPVTSELQSKDAQPAARTLGLQLHVLQAGTERDFEAVFTRVRQLGAGALVIGLSPVFNENSRQLAALALQHAVPTISPYRDFPAAGGLMSYGTDLRDQMRIVGGYTGRILKGEKPADLPVQQATRIALTINMKTAKALGLTFPITLLGRADEVIE